MIDPAVAPHGGEDAERNADNDRDEKARGRELDGRRRVVDYIVEHWAL